MSDISFFLEPPQLPDDPWAVPIEDINMNNARYFYENRQFDFFKLSENALPEFWILFRLERLSNG